jgi:hypothetical protein
MKPRGGTNFGTGTKLNNFGRGPIDDITCIYQVTKL